MPLEQPITTAAYNHLPDPIRWDIDRLHHLVWPDTITPIINGVPETHAPTLNAQSFYIQAEDYVVSYAGVVRLTIHHGGLAYQMAGLSCVATDPTYQGQGLGTRTVGAASKWMEAQTDLDLGLFTCHPTLAGFYCRAGGWEDAPHVILVGSEEEGALRSDRLGVTVMMRLFSKQALDQAPALAHATLSLGLPLGQFL